MESVLARKTVESTVKFDFARFQPAVEMKINEKLLDLVKSVLTEERFKRLEEVPGELTNPLVGQISTSLQVNRRSS